MDNMVYYELEQLKRQLAGLPPKKEIMLPDDAILPSKQVAKACLITLNKILRQKNQSTK